MLGWLRAIGRFWYFAISTLLHILEFGIIILLGKPREQAGIRLRRHWMRHVPKVMGMDVEKIGQPLNTPCLYVANHIGYIDPFFILMSVEANVVAKAEIKKWPLVGLAGYLTGTIFVKRENKDSRYATAQAIETALSAGKSILVFPEGTTSAGPLTLPFRPRSFEAAARAGVPVQPVALYYPEKVVAFIGRDTFIPHFFRLFRLKKIKCRIHFGPALMGDNTVQLAKHWIDQVQGEYEEKINEGLVTNENLLKPQT